jgi:hypothetical protein
MYCNRFKRKCQCTPRPRSNGSKGAEAVYPFYPVSSILQNCCIKIDLFQTRSKGQKKLGLLDLVFFGFSRILLVKETL